jgi:hypothetical protein
MPEKGDHGKIAMTLAYSVTDRLTLGLDYRPLSDDLTGIGSYRLFDENGWHPAMVVGTSADEFNSVLSQSYHVIFSKRLAEVAGISISPYIGPIYIQELEEFNVVGGLTLRRDKISLMGMWSGKDTHIVGKYDINDHLSAGIVWWGLKTTGVTVGVKF